MPRPPELAELDRLLAGRWETRILPGLERIRKALEALGHPERAFPSVLVLGTNGKGSTAAFLASLLRAAGLRVGLYTSPHLVREEERILVDGQPIPSEQLLAWARALARFPELSYFETLTAAAFGAFAEAQVELAVVEAGLGGRWDATNAKDHEVVLLTNVGTDHQAWLGPTREHIAAEKAAAIRGRFGILGQWDPALLPVIRAHAHPDTPLTPASAWAEVELLDASSGLFPTVRVACCGHRFQVTLPLPGRFQRENYQLALAGLAALVDCQLLSPPSLAALQAGTTTTRWPGRLEQVTWRGKPLLLDGAHNREAVEALVDTLRHAGLSGKLNLIFSCLADKPLGAMAALLRPLVRRVTVVPLASPRARALEELAAAFPGCQQAPSVAAALEAADPRVTTLVTGSLRLVGEVKAFLEQAP